MLERRRLRGHESRQRPRSREVQDADLEAAHDGVLPGAGEHAGVQGGSKRPDEHELRRAQPAKARDGVVSRLARHRIGRAYNLRARPGSKSGATVTASNPHWGPDVGGIPCLEKGEPPVLRPDWKVGRVDRVAAQRREVADQTPLGAAVGGSSARHTSRSGRAGCWLAYRMPDPSASHDPSRSGPAFWVSRIGGVGSSRLGGFRREAH